MGNLFSRFVFFKILSWKIMGHFPKFSKYIVAVVPHTSWLDFFIGLMVRSISKEQINFLGKKELFTPLTAWFFKGLGGAPIDRSGKRGSVEAIVAVFDAHDKFRLALAPEGTRRKVKKLKTGYYHIAKNLQIPIVPVAFDYKNKKVIVHPAFYPSDNQASDLNHLEQLFKGVEGFSKAKSF